MAEDFSLSASLNIQRVDVSKVRDEILKLSKSGINIPITFDSNSIKNAVPQNVEVTLSISNAQPIQKEMEKIFSVEGIIDGLANVVNAQIQNISRAAAKQFQSAQKAANTAAAAQTAAQQKASTAAANAASKNRRQAGAAPPSNQVPIRTRRTGGGSPAAAQSQLSAVNQVTDTIAKILAKAQTDTELSVESIISLLGRLDDASPNNRAGDTGFFKSAKNLVRALTQTGVVSPVKGIIDDIAKGGSGPAGIQKDFESLTTVVERFAGTSGKSGANLEAALNKVVVGLQDVERIRAKLAYNGLLTQDTIKSLQEARTRIIELLNTTEAANPTTLNSTINKAIIAPLNDAFSDALDQKRQFDKQISQVNELRALEAQRNQPYFDQLRSDLDQATQLRKNLAEEITKLEIEKADIQQRLSIGAIGGRAANQRIGEIDKELAVARPNLTSADTIEKTLTKTIKEGSELDKNLKAQLEILNKNRVGGLTLNLVNSGKEMAELKLRQEELERIQQRSESAQLALSKVFDVRLNQTLFQTEAAQLLNAVGKVEEVSKTAEERVQKALGGNTKGVKKSDPSIIGAQVEQDISNIENLVQLLNGALNKIDTTKLDFKNAGLTESANAMGVLRDQTIALAKQLIDGSVSAEEFSKKFEESFVKTQFLQKKEKEFLNLNNQLLKLEQNLQSSGKAGDIFGAGLVLSLGKEELEDAFRGGKTEKELKLIADRTKTAVTEAQSLNKAYADLAVNFEKSAAKQNQSFDKRQFEAAGQSFQDYAKTLIGSGQNVGEVLRLLRIKYQELNGEAQRNIKLPPTLNKILETLSSKKIGFESKGQDKAAEEIDKLSTSIKILSIRGADAEQIRKVFNRGLVDVDRINQDEKALEKYRISLEKLRVSLKAPDAATDFFKAGKTLEEGAATFDNVKNAGAQKEVLTSRLAAITAEVKARQRLNSTVDSLINKFADLEAAQTRTAAVLTFRKAGADFTKTVQRIVAGGGDIQQQLRTIQSEFIRTRISASIEAEGGFLGSISKLAGLATKRLLAFVGIARLTFAIQSAFTEAVSAGLELEVQTNKLEQVFAKTFTTEESLVKATNDVTDAIFKMSQEYGVAVGEVTKASRILAQAGFSGEALTKSLEAISKANLTATFNDINQTAEASIAVLNQFKLEADQLEAVLGGINRVSSLYAVESEGIAKAVRKAGGAFQNAGGNISEFVGAFTILKKETREADEALATALRNISIRLQRTTIQDKVGGLLGIDFLNKQGQFIGVGESLGLISAKLKELNIASTDPRFAAVVENIAGARQFARLIPLLNQYGELAEIQDEFNKGAGSLDDDAARAMTTLNNKMEQLRSTFAELSNAVLTSDLFKNLVDGLNLVVKGLNKAVKLFGNMNVLLLAAAGIALPKIITSGFAFKFLEGAGANPFGVASKLFNRNSGGIIPGRGANADTVPAMLTRGEYVIQRDAVDKYGVGFFDRVNAKKYNRGGRVGYNTGSPGGVGSRINNIADVIIKAFEKGGDLLIEKFNSQIELDDNLTAVKKRDEQALEKSSNPTTAPPLAPFNRNPIKEKFIDIEPSETAAYFRDEPPEYSRPLGSNSTVDRRNVNYDELLPQTPELPKTKSKVSDLFDSITSAADGTKQKISSGFNVISGNITSGIQSVDKVLDGVIKRFEDVGDVLINIASGTADIARGQKAAPRPSGVDSVTPAGLRPKQKSRRKIKIDNDSINDILNQPDERSFVKRRRNRTDAEIGSGVDRSRSNAAAFAQAGGSRGMGRGFTGAGTSGGNIRFPNQKSLASGGSSQIAKLISSLGPVTPMLLKFTGGLGLGATALSMFAHITEESSLSVNDWVVALGTGAATFGATIALFNTLNGLLATANARLALANVKGFVGDFKAGFGRKGVLEDAADFIGPKRPDGLPRKLSRAESIGRLTSGVGGRVSSARTAVSKGLNNSGILGKLLNANVGSGAKSIGSKLLKIPGAATFSKFLGTAGQGLARFGGVLAGSGGLLAPFVGGLSAATVVFKALGSAAAANAQEMLNEAKTREEAAEALDKFDFSDRLSSGFGVFTAISNIGESIGSTLSNFGKGLYDTFPIIGDFASSVSGWASYIANLLPESEKVLLEQGTRRSFSNAKFDLKDSNEATTGLASEDQGKVDASQKQIRKNLNSAAVNILDGIYKGAKAQGIKMSDFIKTSDAGLNAAKELKKNVENAIKNGVEFDNAKLADINKVFQLAGLKLDVDALQKGVAALDRTSLLFLRMEVIAQQVANNITAVQGNLSKFDQVLNSLTGDSFDFQIPDQVFDLIDKGVDPAALGLEGFSERIKEKLNSINPAEAALFNLEFGAKELSRKLNESIAATGDEIKFDPNVGGDPENPGTTVGNAVAVQLQERAAGISSGAILDAYNDFIATKTSEFEKEAEAASEAGVLFKLTAQQINDINKEFADTYQKGGIENLKKRFQIEAEFTNRYASILSKRFALEDQYADRLNRGLDIEKTRTEFSNKLKDPTESGDLTGKQSEVLDQRRLANLLKDTGLSGSSSVKDIEAKLFQSEERLREFSTDTDRNGNVRNIPARDRQLGAQLEKRQQEQLQNALELLASGGEKGAAAMRAFEKASEQAQKASERFLNTFLGSDEDLLNSGRAAALFDAVVKAGETGGTGKAKEVLRTADPRARQALNALSGQDDDIKKGLKSALGVSGVVPSTSPEATGVEKILAQQAEAQAALSATTERQITSLDNLSKMLQGDENNAVQQMMNNINQAAVVVNEAAKNMANIPQKIIHQHKIADINVNFIGAANLEVLQEGFKEAIINTVKNEISASNAKLFRNNPNLLPN